jgi:hypothetical protein
LDAWEHGWQAEHDELCAWAMDASATIAMYANRPEAARDAARDAARKGLAQAPPTSAAAVRVSCQLTRANACLGANCNQLSPFWEKDKNRFARLLRWSPTPVAGSPCHPSLTPGALSFGICNNCTLQLSASADTLESL